MSAGEIVADADKESGLGRRQFLTQEELSPFLKRNSLWALMYFIISWGMIVGACALVVFFPFSFWSWPIALVVLGGRQMSLAALMHECSHNTLFNSKKLNQFFGQWFAAYPILLDMKEYWNYHLPHHRYTGKRFDGEKGDPDLALIRFYPLSKKGYLRWLKNDLTGKVQYNQLRLNLGFRLEYLKSGRRGRIERGPAWERPLLTRLKDFTRTLHGPLIVHGLFIALVIAFNLYPALIAWWVAQFTIYPTILRIRVIAEHGVTDRGENILRNTRTVYAGPIARVLIAAHNLNYHLEHHLYIGVPAYRLRPLHKLLKQKGALDNAQIANNYLEVLKLATSA